MRTWHYFDLETGLFTGSHESHDGFEGIERWVAGNTPKGYGAIEGTYDRLSQRVDVARVATLRASHIAAHTANVGRLRAAFGGRDTMGRPMEFREPPAPPFVTPRHLVIDYQPQAPSDEHAWDPQTKRWQLTAAAQASRQARVDALAEISRLEHDVQPGVLRDVALGKEGALERLRALDEQVAAFAAIAIK